MSLSSLYQRTAFGYTDTVPRSLAEGTQSLMSMRFTDSIDSAAGVLAHELEHNFGAMHASCISDENRSAE